MDHAMQEFVDWVGRAPALEQMEAERQGVRASVVKAMAREMGLSVARFFEIIGIPKATAEKKAAANGFIDGAAGQAALGIAALLSLAQELVEASTSAEAKGFDSTRWVGQWLETPNLALGGERPANMMDAPTGRRIVHNLLAGLASGAYQ